MTAPRPSDDRPEDQAVLEFLAAHHGQPVTDLEALYGGHWSAAYGYRVGREELVLRLNQEPDGFRDDEAAMAYTSASLPVPEVLTIGQGLGRWFAVSRRHHGRFLEYVSTEEADAVAPTVIGLLDALRSVPDSGVDTKPWRAWLLGGLTDHNDSVDGAGAGTGVDVDVGVGHNAGWRHLVAAHPAAERAFTEAEARIRDLLDVCVDRRQLVHGDLLHHNVLLSPNGDAVTAIFSWKCSTWGDALYDLAWCSFWGRWHEGIGALNLWDRVSPTLPAAEATDAAVRHHAYELHIGASHLGWYASIGDTDNLAWTASQLDELLKRGPLEAAGKP